MDERTTRAWGTGRSGSGSEERLVSKGPGVVSSERPSANAAAIAASVEAGYQPDIVLILKEDGTILFLNRSVPDTPDGSAVGRSIYAYVSLEHQNAVRHALSRVFTEGASDAFVCNGKPPFAPDAWYHCRIAPNQRSTGVVSATVIARDITRWKRSEDEFRAQIEELQAKLDQITADREEVSALLAEQERREQELSRFRKIMDQAGEAIFITDPETGRFVDANETACRWLGQRREKLLTMGVQDLDLDFPLESADGVADHVTDTRDADRPSVYDSGSHRRRNGTSFPVEVALARRKFGDRQYMLVVARDVNRRHRTEQALRESEDKYRSLFDLSRDAIYLSARDGSVSDVNDSAIDLFGYTRAEFVGLEARKLYKNHEDIREFQRIVQEQGAVRDLEVEFLTKLGQTFKGYLAATLRTDGEGNIHGYQCIVSPIRQPERLVADVKADEQSEGVAGQQVDDRNTVVVAGKDKWVIDDTRAVLERAGVEVLSARTAAAAVELVRTQPDKVGVVVIDFPTDDPEFQDAVREIREVGAGVRVIMFESETGRGDQTSWADAVVRKPLHPLALAQQVRESLSAFPRPDLDL